MRIEAQSNRSCTSREGRVEHLVRLRFTAPIAEPTAARLPVNVSFVMDRSASMQGEKIETARAAIDASVRMLREADRFSVVMFNHEVSVTTHSTEATDTARLRAQNRVNRTTADGNTNLSGGWFEGARQVGGFHGNGHVSRVLLATDGQANAGVTDDGQLFEHARRLRSRGVSTSTIGIGADFNEALLQGIAEAGGGNFYYVEHASQLTELLTSELGEALSITVREPRVELSLPEGAEVTLLNSFAVDTSDGGYSVVLDDLTSGQAVDLHFVVTLPAAAESLAMGFVIRGGVGRVVLASTALRWQGVPAGMFERAPRDLLVETAVARKLVAQARRQALELNSAGRFQEAEQVMRDVAARLMPLAATNPALRDLLHGAEDEGVSYRAAMSDLDMKARRMVSYSERRGRDSLGRAAKEFRD